MNPVRTLLENKLRQVAKEGEPPVLTVQDAVEALVTDPGPLMTVFEARVLRTELELKIQDLLHAYTASTKLYVEWIGIEELDGLYRVKVSLRI